VTGEAELAGLDLMHRKIGLFRFCILSTPPDIWCARTDSLTVKVGSSTGRWRDNRAGIAARDRLAYTCHAAIRATIPAMIPRHAAAISRSNVKIRRAVVPLTARTLTGIRKATPSNVRMPVSSGCAP